VKRLAIVYGTDGEYIREVLSHFQLRELRRGGYRKYIAVAWGAMDEDRRVWSVNDRFEIEEEISDRPPVFQEAVILNLPAGAEQSLHGKISSFLQERNVALFNPYPASRKAGNKYFTISRLAAKNIPVPESLLLRKSDPAKIIPRLSVFLARHQASGFYAQPNEGTEGRETYFFSADEFQRSPDFAAEIVSGILRDREVIVKKARGNVFYYKRQEQERGYRPVTFRVFLWQPEDKVEADLGFAEISASENDFVPSPEKGGRIITPSEAMADLYYRETAGFRRIVLTEEEARSLPAAAVRALAAFNSGLRQKLRIAGVDLLLEVTDGKVRPVVLEINPRPSGLDKLAPWGQRAAAGGRSDH
jgi:hypothetical protein